MAGGRGRGRGGWGRHVEEYQYYKIVTMWIRVPRVGKVGCNGDRSHRRVAVGKQNVLHIDFVFGASCAADGISFKCGGMCTRGLEWSGAEAEAARYVQRVH